MKTARHLEHSGGSGRTPLFTKPPGRRKKGSFQASGAASTKPKSDCARGTGTSSSPRQPAAICKEHRGTYGCNPQEVSAGGHPQTSAWGSELRHASHVLAHIPASQPVTPGSPAPGPASWLQLQPRGPGEPLSVTLTGGGLHCQPPFLRLTCLPLLWQCCRETTLGSILLGTPLPL